MKFKLLCPILYFTVPEYYLYVIGWGRVLNFNFIPFSRNMVYANINVNSFIYDLNSERFFAENTLGLPSFEDIFNCNFIIIIL